MNKYKVKVESYGGYDKLYACLFVEERYVKLYENYYSNFSDSINCISNKEVENKIKSDLKRYGNIIESDYGSIQYLESDIELDDLLNKLGYNDEIYFSLREHHMLEMMNNFSKYHYDYLIRDTFDFSGFMTFDFKLIVNPEFEESNHYETFFIKENGENVFADDGRIIPNSNNDFKLLKNKKVYKINELLNCPIKEENKIKKERQEITNSIYDFLIKETNCEVNNGYIDYIEYYFLGEKEDIRNLFSVDKYLINKWLDEYEYNIKLIDESDDEIYDILSIDFLETFWENEIDDSYLFENQDKIKEIITPEKFILYKLSQYAPYDCSKNLIKNKMR